jgi:hypothetical protein
MKSKLLLLLSAGVLALFADGACAQVTTQRVGVCDPTAYSAGNCLKPNADGSINTSAGGTTSYSTTDKGTTVTAGGTAQAAIASNASRKAWCIQNDPAATETLSVRLNGTASATTGTILQAGQQACNQAGVLDTAAVSVFAATTGHRFFGFEGQ